VKQTQPVHRILVGVEGAPHSLPAIALAFRVASSPQRFASTPAASGLPSDRMIPTAQYGYETGGGI